MLTFDSLPQARVVRSQGQLVTPPPVPTEPSGLGEGLRNALGVALGLWPLTSVILLALGLLIMAGHWSSP